MPDSAGASSNAKELEEFRIIARSILMPFKQGCTVNQFNSEYYETCGESVPYKKFGYFAMQDFFHSLPDVIKFGTNRDGQQVMFAISTEDTQHVQALVRGQKATKSKRPAGRSFSASRRVPIRQPSFYSRSASQPRSTFTQSVRSSASQNVEYFQFLKTFNQQKHAGGRQSFPPRFSSAQNPPSPNSTRSSSSPVTSRRSSFEIVVESASTSSTSGASLKPSLSNEKSVKQELEQVAKQLNLGQPIYRPMKLMKGQQHMCSIKIGVHTVSSVSIFPSAEAAEIAAAKNAVTFLKQHYATNGSLENGGGTNVSMKGSSSSNSSRSSDSQQASPSLDDDQHFEEIVENILQLLDNYSSGIWSSSLSQEYLKKYGKPLPSDWMKQVEENAPEIALIKIDHRFIVSKNIRPPPVAMAATVQRHHLLLAPTDSKNAVNLNEIIAEDEPELPPTASPDNQIDTPLDSNSNSADVTAADHALVANGQNLTPTEDDTSTSTVFTNIIYLGEKKPPPSAIEANLTAESESISEEVDISKTNFPSSQQQPRRSVTWDENIEVRDFSLTDEERSIMFAPPMIIHSRQPNPLIFPDEVYFQAHIVLVVSPADFVFRLNAYDEQFLEMRLKMEQFYSTNEGDPIEKPEDLNSMFFAAKAEECWNRVSLLEAMPSQRAVRVYFIDHGDEEVVEFENLRQLEPEFVACPAQAVKACLKGFENWSFEDFDEDVVQRFRDLALNKYLMCQRCFDGEPILQYDIDSTISVVLYGEPNETAPSSEDHSFDVVVNELIEALIPNEQFDAFQNGAIAAVDNSDDEEQSLSKKKDENPFLQSNNVGQTATATTVTSCTSEPIDANKPVVTAEPTCLDISENGGGGDTEAPLNGASLLLDQKLEEISDLQPYAEFGQEFQALVVFAVDPFEFTVQPACYVDQLNELTANLKAFYESAKPEYEFCAKKGDFCAANVNGAYFRAYCANDKIGVDKLSMFLVDYGEFYTCSKEHAYFLHPLFRQLPMLSVQCSLHGVQPYDKFSKSFDVVSSLKFGEAITNRQYKAVVRSSRSKTAPNKPSLPHLDVDLLDSVNGESVADWLVAQKYAAFTL